MFVYSESTILATNGDNLIIRRDFTSSSLSAIIQILGSLILGDFISIQIY